MLLSADLPRDFWFLVTQKPKNKNRYTSDSEING